MSKPRMSKPSWAEFFQHRYHFRVRFEDLPDGRKPVVNVQVVSYDFESARKKALLEVKQMFKDDPMVLRTSYTIVGYKIS